MIIELPIKGSGTDNDPFTVNLPTWSMIGSPDENGLVLIDIPDREFPLDDPRWIGLVSELQGEQTVITSVPVDALTAWLEHMSTRYAVDIGRYAPF